MIEAIEKGIRKITNFLCLLAMILLAVLMLLGAVDVIGRYFFSYPIKGAYEMSEVILAGLVFMGLAYTASVQGHVSVDSFVNRFHPALREVIGMIVSLVSLVMFALIGWQGAVMAHKSWVSRRLVDVIEVPIGPFQLFVTVGALAVCLELVVQFLKHLKNVRGEA